MRTILLLFTSFCCIHLYFMFTAVSYRMFFHWCSFMYPHWGFSNKQLDLPWLRQQGRVGLAFVMSHHTLTQRSSRGLHAFVVFLVFVLFCFTLLLPGWYFISHYRGGSAAGWCFLGSLSRCPLSRVTRRSMETTEDRITGVKGRSNAGLLVLTSQSWRQE